MYDWDDPLENEQKEFTLIPEGGAYFNVTGFTRSRRTVGKLGECMVADVELQLESEIDGSIGTAKDSFPIHPKMTWKLFQLAEAIGDREKGDQTPVTPSVLFGNIKGRTGRCEVSHREWQGRDKVVKVINVDKYTAHEAVNASDEPDF